MDVISFLGIPTIVVGFVGFGFAWLLFSYVPVRLWIAAWASGVRIGLGTLVGVRLRKVPLKLRTIPMTGQAIELCRRCGTSHPVVRFRSVEEGGSHDPRHDVIL